MLIQLPRIGLIVSPGGGREAQDVANGADTKPARSRQIVARIRVQTGGRIVRKDQFMSAEYLVGRKPSNSAMR